MRLIIQRVKKASVVRVSDGKTVGSIGSGFFVLVGFKKNDNEEMIDQLATKLSKLRIMADEEEKMNRTVAEVGGQILVVSQFTLYADTSGGNRPSFVDAEDSVKAKVLYDLFVEKVKKSGIKTETGSFGDYMKIDSELDGPVTIVLSSQRA